MRLLLFVTYSLIVYGLHAQVTPRSLLGKNSDEVFSLISKDATQFTLKHSSNTFPISENSIQNLVVDNWTPDGTIVIDKIIFTFVDNICVFIQSSDPQMAKFMEKLAREKPIDYGGHIIYPEYAIAIKKDNRRTSIFDKKYLHGHLFLWENPELINEIKRRPRRIDLLTMPLGGTIASIMTQFDPRCQLINKVTIKDSSVSPTGNHIQVNCFGYDVFSFPRKLELIFVEGRLEYMWILTTKEEHERLKDLLQARMGGIQSETENFVWFTGGKVALRKDIPEVLICSEDFKRFFARQ